MLAAVVGLVAIAAALVVLAVHLTGTEGDDRAGSSGRAEDAGSTSAEETRPTRTVQALPVVDSVAIESLCRTGTGVAGVPPYEAGNAAQHVDRLVLWSDEGQTHVETWDGTEAMQREPSAVMCVRREPLEGPSIQCPYKEGFAATEPIFTLRWVNPTHWIVEFRDVGSGVVLHEERFDERGPCPDTYSVAAGVTDPVAGPRPNLEDLDPIAVAFAFRR